MSTQHFYDGRDLEVLAGMPRYYAWITDCFKPHLGGAAIEFGAGTGAISSRIRPFVDSLELIEPSANLSAVLAERFAADGAVNVHQETLEDFLDGAPKGGYTSIVMVNVLEHIEDDAAAAEGLLRLLQPGGKLLLFVPAMPFLFSKLDEQFGHYRRYVLDQMQSMLEGVGFRVHSAQYMDMLGIVPWWLVNTIGGKTDFDPRLVKLYDTVGIPVARFVEGLYSPPVGKNVMMIASRPGD